MRVTVKDLPIEHLKKAYRRKYRNKPVVIDNIRFSSTAEGTRYNELKWRKSAGEIRGLRLQPKYDLHVNGVLIGRYVPDFDYYENDKLVVEDVKGFKTDLYSWKKKHFEAEYGIKLTEVRNGKRETTIEVMPQSHGD